MFEFYNPHPQQKIVGDCVKRAFTKATGRTYQEVSKDLNAIKRAQGASAYNVNTVWLEYANKTLGAKKISFPAQKGESRMTGVRFCEDYPKGVYILNMAKHLSCCVDGVIYDTWDCSDKCVYYALEIPQVAEEVVEDIPVKAASSGPKRRPLNGEEVIQEFSKMTLADIKVTKKEELWIPLSPHQYSLVLESLLKDKKFRHLRWETKKGSKKSKIWDEETGMTLILKNGSNPYIWCTDNGK